MSVSRPALSRQEVSPRTQGSALTTPFVHSRITLSVCLAVVALVIGLGIAAATSDSWTRFELSVDQFFSANHVAVLDSVALAIAWLLAPGPGLALVALSSLVVLWRTRSWLTGLTFALAAGGGWLAAEPVKVIVHRARPDGTLLANPLLAETSFDSFPSGHTCLATALVVTTVLMFRSHRARRWIIAGGVAVVILVAWSRLYVGAHYPLDVLAAIVSTCAVVVAFLVVWNCVVVPRLERRTIDRDRRKGDVAQGERAGVL